jgi:hypothetical protein
VHFQLKCAYFPLHAGFVGRAGERPHSEELEEASTEQEEEWEVSEQQARLQFRPESWHAHKIHDYRTAAHKVHAHEMHAHEIRYHCEQ